MGESGACRGAQGRAGPDVQGGGVTAATGQRFLPGKMNFPETSISKPTIFSVSQFPELKGSKAVIRRMPGTVPRVRGGKCVFRKGSSSVSIPRRARGRPQGQGCRAGAVPVSPPMGPVTSREPPAPKPIFLTYKLMSFVKTMLIFGRRPASGSSRAWGSRSWEGWVTTVTAPSRSIQEGRLHCEAVLGCPLGAVPEADLLAPEGSSLILRETIFQTLPGQHTVPRVTSYMLGSSRGRLGASQSLAGTG